VETKETVKSRVSNGEATSKSMNDIIPDIRNSGNKVSNNSSSSERHLTSRKNITNKGSKHHNKEDNNTNVSNHFSRRSIRTVVKTSTDMNINSNKEHRGPVSVGITN
jgi:hypothetical protein